MIQRFHGIDRHKHYSTISVKNREGKEIRFIGRCDNLRSYVNTLGPDDAVAIESSTGSFHWADQIESRGSLCFVLDPFRFKIIRESWKKCDKHDSRNMATALWVHVVTGEFGLPTVYKPDVPIPLGLHSKSKSAPQKFLRGATCQTGCRSYPDRVDPQSVWNNA